MAELGLIIKAFEPQRLCFIYFKTNILGRKISLISSSNLKGKVISIIKSLIYILIGLRISATVATNRAINRRFKRLLLHHEFSGSVKAKKLKARSLFL